MRQYLRNSPDHIGAAAAIDTNFFWRLCGLRDSFLAENKGLLATDLEESPLWQAASATLKTEWAAALDRLREAVVDAADDTPPGRSAVHALGAIESH